MSILRGALAPVASPNEDVTLEVELLDSGIRGESPRRMSTDLVSDVVVLDRHLSRLGADVATAKVA